MGSNVFSWLSKPCKIHEAGSGIQSVPFLVLEANWSVYGFSSANKDSKVLALINNYNLLGFRPKGIVLVFFSFLGWCVFQRSNFFWKNLHEFFTRAMLIDHKMQKRYFPRVRDHSSLWLSCAFEKSKQRLIWILIYHDFYSDIELLHQRFSDYTLELIFKAYK